MTGRGEQGSGSTLAVAGLLLTSLIVVGMLLAGTAVVAQGQVRDAADLVAVSAATARAGGDDPCRAAAEFAAANQVELARCSVAGDDLDLVVSVVVTRRLTLPNSGLGFDLRAAANAGWLATAELG